MDGIKIDDVPEALCKNIMKQYCGKSGMSIQTYKLKNQKKYDDFIHIITNNL